MDFRASPEEVGHLVALNVICSNFSTGGFSFLFNIQCLKIWYYINLDMVSNIELCVNLYLLNILFFEITRTLQFNSIVYSLMP